MYVYIYIYTIIYTIIYILYISSTPESRGLRWRKPAESLAGDFLQFLDDIDDDEDSQSDAFNSPKLAGSAKDESERR